MSPNKVLKLCTINLTEESVDGIVKVLRTAGIAVHAQAHKRHDEQTLNDHLDQFAPTLVMVGNEGDFDIGQASATFRKKIPNVPRLLVANSNGESRNLALQFQYNDIVEIINEAWLIHIVSREWNNYKAHCANESLQLELDNINDTHQQMVASTENGIAYVSDGFHVTCTQRYASMFEFDNESDVMITPLIDLIAPSHQANFRDTLKAFEKGQEKSAEIETTAISSTGKPMPVKLTVSKSLYDGEPALQLTASSNASSTCSEGAESTDVFLKQIDYFLAVSKKSKQHGSIVCIQPWNFWKTRHKVGIILSSTVLLQLFEFLTRHANKDHTVARIGSDFFSILMPNTTPKQALKISEQLALAIEEHVFEVEGISVNCFCRAGIVAYNGKTKQTPSGLINQAFDVVATFTSGDTEEKARIFEPPKEKDDGFDPNQTLSKLTQSGGIKLSYQPVLCLREDPHEIYEVIPSILDSNGDAMDITALAAAKVSPKKESKFDRWILSLLVARMVKQVKRAPRTRLIVSLSADAFADKSLLAWFVELCQKNKLSRNHFIFQWQEQMVTDKLKHAATFLAVMKKARMQYGFTHYEPSLDASKTLTTLKPKLLKVHDNIALKALEDQKSAAVLSDILAEAAVLDSSVIIACVDSPSTLASLWQSGASFVQGSYIQEPSANMEFDFTEMAM